MSHRSSSSYFLKGVFGFDEKSTFLFSYFLNTGCGFDEKSTSLFSYLLLNMGVIGPLILILFLDHLFLVLAEISCM